MKNIRKTKWILTIVFMILLPLPLIYVIVRGIPSNYSQKIVPILFGITAYVWMLFTLYLATKPKWIEKLIGLPELYVLHGLVPIAGVIALALHSQSLSAEGLVKYFGGAGGWIFTLITLLSIVYFATWLSSRVKFIDNIKKTLKEKINHETFVWIHRFNVLATIFIFIHISLIKDIRSIKYFYPLLILYFVFAMVSYFSMIYKFYFNSNKAKLINVEKLDNTVVELTIQINQKILNQIIPGNFIFIKFPNFEKLNSYHPFSIVSKDERNIKIAVSELGDFTKELKNLKPGELLNISEPYGVLNSVVKSIDSNENLTIIAGGIGITPMISLINDNLNKNIDIIYTVSPDKTLLFEDERNNWGNYENIKVYSLNSRIDNNFIVKQIRNYKESKYILAGPPAMIEGMKKMLINLGIDKENIFFEAFGW